MSLISANLVNTKDTYELNMNSREYSDNRHRLIRGQVEQSQYQDRTRDNAPRSRGEVQQYQDRTRYQVQQSRGQQVEQSQYQDRTRNSLVPMTGVDVIQHQSQINYKDIFLKHANNSCYYNSSLQLLLSMPEVCDLIMRQGNDRNLLYKIINYARRTGGRVETKDMKDEYLKCIVPNSESTLANPIPTKWGDMNPTEAQLALLLDFGGVNNANEIKDLIYGYNGQHNTKYNEKEAQDYPLPMMVLNQGLAKISTIELLINNEETGSLRHYKLRNKQQYAIINIQRKQPIPGADQRVTGDPIIVSDQILVDGKVMELKGLIHYTAAYMSLSHYVFFAKEGNTWSLYDDLEEGVIRGMSEPLYKGNNVLNHSIIYLYKLFDCSKVL